MGFNSDSDLLEHQINPVHNFNFDESPHSDSAESDNNTSDKKYNIPNVKNRLSDNIGFWKQIGASPWVLEIIQNGYALPFVQEPQPAFFTNNKSAFEAYSFVTSEINDLLAKGCIKEINRQEAHIISPLSVANNGEKPRLILDLRYLNSFIATTKFKYEDIRTVRDLFNKGDYFFKADLKSGYHHLNIFEQHQKFLSFAWNIDGVTRYFCFTVLVFGLASAPFVFTKVVRTLIKYWRKSGIKNFCLFRRLLWRCWHF